MKEIPIYTESEEQEDLVPKVSPLTSSSQTKTMRMLKKKDSKQTSKFYKKFKMVSKLKSINSHLNLIHPYTCEDLIRYDYDSSVSLYLK